MSYNSDEYLNAQHEQYQKRISEAEWKEKESLCDKCGSWRETDLDGSILDIDCVVCDEIEHVKWLSDQELKYIPTPIKKKRNNFMLSKIQINRNIMASLR